MRQNKVMLWQWAPAQSVVVTIQCSWGPTFIMARGDPTPARWTLRLARRARLKALARGSASAAALSRVECERTRRGSWGWGPTNSDERFARRSGRRRSAY